MKTLRRLIIIGIPIGAFLTPQISESIQFPLALILMGTSVLFVHYSRKPDFNIRGYWGSIAKGLLLYLSLTVFVSTFPIGAWLSRPLLLPHSTENAQAIVVLACGFKEKGSPDFGGLQRFLHALKLFREGRAPRIIQSTSEIVREGNRQAYWIASLTRLIGLSSDSIEITMEGVDTRSEARRLAEKLFPRNIRRILLVTNGPHILRTVRSFEKVGFEVLPAPVQTEENIIEADGGAALFHFALHEWIGNFVYWLRGDIDYPFRKS